MLHSLGRALALRKLEPYKPRNIPKRLLSGQVDLSTYDRPTERREASVTFQNFYITPRACYSEYA
jgi:hypothetical protein